MDRVGIIVGCMFACALCENTRAAGEKITLFVEDENSKNWYAFHHLAQLFEHSKISIVNVYNTTYLYMYVNSLLSYPNTLSFSFISMAGLLHSNIQMHV